MNINYAINYSPVIRSHLWSVYMYGEWELATYLVKLACSLFIIVPYEMNPLSVGGQNEPPMPLISNPRGNLPSLTTIWAFEKSLTANLSVKCVTSDPLFTSFTPFFNQSVARSVFVFPRLIGADGQGQGLIMSGWKLNKNTKANNIFYHFL